MPRSLLTTSFFLFGFVYSALAQQPAAAPAPPAPERPPLFFKEDFRLETVGGQPVTQADLYNPNLELKLYGDGPGGTNPDHGIWIFRRAQPKDDPSYIWTGRCASSCAVALRDKTNFIDLSGLGKIKWRTMQAGFHMLRPMVKLGDGTWLVGDHTDGYTADWHESEITLSEIRWRQLDIKTVLTTGNGKWIEHPDLSKVDEIGFTDLMRGSGNGAGGTTRVDWIEVYGKPVKR